MNNVPPPAPAAKCKTRTKPNCICACHRSDKYYESDSHERFRAQPRQGEQAVELDYRQIIQRQAQIIRQQTEIIRQQEQTIRQQAQTIRRQQARIAELEQVVAQLTARVEELSAEVARLSKNSSNSSKPPSSDITKPPKPPTQNGDRRRLGGQPGHARHERTPFAPDQINRTIDYRPDRCPDCGARLRPANRPPRTLQQVELPEIPLVITEHRADEQPGRAGHPLRGPGPPRHPGHPQPARPTLVRTYLDRHGHLRPAGQIGVRVPPSDPRCPLRRPPNPIPFTHRAVNGYNLANEIGLAGSRPALLIDLDWYYGATAPYLGIDSKYGLSDVLSHNSHIDAELVRSTAVAYSDAIHVMLSPVSTSLSRAGFIRWRQLIPVLKVCRAAYPCTIIDAPRVPAHLATAIAGISQAVLIVFQLAVKDIHIVRSIRAAMVERGVPAERIIPVVSRYTRRSQITLEEARTVLDGSRLMVLSNDYATAIKSVNYGKPLAQTAPSTALRREIRQLAVELGSDKQGGRP